MGSETKNLGASADVKYLHKQPENFALDGSSNDVNIKFSQSVDNIPTMKITGNAASQDGGIEFFFICDGRRPATIGVNYKVDGSATMDITVYDTAGATTTDTGNNSASMTRENVSISGGTWTDGSLFRVLVKANVGNGENVWIGDCLVTY
jgi:hypothetical protein